MTVDQWTEDTWSIVLEKVNDGEDYASFINLANLMNDCTHIILDELHKAESPLAKNNFDDEKHFSILADLHEEAHVLISRVIGLHRDFCGKLTDLTGEPLNVDNPDSIHFQIIQDRVMFMQSRVHASKVNMRDKVDIICQFRKMSKSTRDIAQRSADLSLTGIFWGVGGFIIGITAYFFMLTTTMINY